ncbi:MAG TPA: archease [Dehalococcoidia bacterium]|nr:archease [Dehalococcoidia bacterium]
MEASYEVLEHTADAGIVARGATLAAAFAAAAEGMYSLMVDPARVRERLNRQVETSGRDMEHMLSNWLLELLLLTEVENLVFSRFEVEIEGQAVRGTAFGEELDEARHDVRGMIKGVTRHMLSVEQASEGYAARVVFDM